MERSFAVFLALSASSRSCVFLWISFLINSLPNISSRLNSFVPASSAIAGMSSTSVCPLRPNPMPDHSESYNGKGGSILPCRGGLFQPDFERSTADRCSAASISMSPWEPIAPDRSPSRWCHRICRRSSGRGISGNRTRGRRWFPLRAEDRTATRGSSRHPHRARRLSRLPLWRIPRPASG